MTQLLRRPDRRAAVVVRAGRARRRRAWVVLVAAPLAPFLAAYLCAGGRALLPVALAGAGLALVLSTVSVIARWSARRDAKEAKTR
jgi:hypothetical protein